MPRNKRTADARRVIDPVRLQDATGLDDRIATTVVATVVQPVLTRLIALEEAVAALERGVVHEAVLELPAGRRSGIVYVEPPGGFVAEAIGAPVLVSQRASLEDEYCIAGFTAEVLDERRMRVAFWCASPVPKQLSIVYLIG